MNKNKTEESIYWSLCEGCSCYNNNNKELKCSAGNEPFLDNSLCPCINCLLKMCCSQICEKFIYHTKKISMTFFDKE